MPRDWLSRRFFGRISPQYLHISSPVGLLELQMVIRVLPQNVNYQTPATLTTPAQV